MKHLTLTLPALGFIVGTRAALAFGAGLLLSAKIPKARRRAIGMTLVTIGAATTLPALAMVRRRLHDEGASAGITYPTRDE
jgi:uncharacterized membrane protein YhaH (DUF805 family)